MKIESLKKRAGGRGKNKDNMGQMRELWKELKEWSAKIREDWIHLERNTPVEKNRYNNSGWQELIWQWNEPKN